MNQKEMNEVQKTKDITLIKKMGFKTSEYRFIHRLCEGNITEQLLEIFKEQEACRWLLDDNMKLSTKQEINNFK